MKLFTDKDLELYVRDRIQTAIERAQETWEGRFKLEEEGKAWQIRRLEAQKDDAEADRDRYRAAYKGSIKKLKDARKRGAELSRQLNNAGMLPDPELDKMKDGSPRKLNSVQAVVDQVMTELPGVDDAGQGAVRAYVERELRMRGIDQAEMIAAEVIAGGFLSDED